MAQGAHGSRSTGRRRSGGVRSSPASRPRSRVRARLGARHARLIRARSSAPARRARGIGLAAHRLAARPARLARPAGVDARRARPVLGRGAARPRAGRRRLHRRADRARRGERRGIGAHRVGPAPADHRLARSSTGSTSTPNFGLAAEPTGAGEGWSESPIDLSALRGFERRSRPEASAPCASGASRRGASPPPRAWRADASRRTSRRSSSTAAAATARIAVDAAPAAPTLSARLTFADLDVRAFLDAAAENPPGRGPRRRSRSTCPAGSSPSAR